MAVILCQKAQISGVSDFRISRVGTKWRFEITPEEPPGASVGMSGQHQPEKA